MSKEPYHSRVYTDRPPYADFDAPAKFTAIESIIAKRLKQHPNAICSYSGGADSDILIDLIERVRKMFSLPPVQYAFFNTGLEMKATKDHVKATAEKYGVEIREYRPKKGFDIVSATRRHEQPPTFKISAKCCDCCKKDVAHRIQKDFDMVITGERRDEGGMRSVPRKDNTAMCFTETADGKYRLRPLYYVSDADKAWYKEYYGIKYSDAYEVYGLTRTGCCGCPISYKAVADLEKIKPFEPTVVKAAWNIFGDSYRYRQAYNDYKSNRMREEAELKAAEKIKAQTPPLFLEE